MVLERVSQFTGDAVKRGNKIISYSQMSMFWTCPRKWKLTYIDKHREDVPGIEILFGSAFHKTLQDWIRVLYEGSVKESEQFSFEQHLRSDMVAEYNKAKQQFPNREITDKFEMQQYFEEGTAVLEWIRKKRAVYFPKKNIKLSAIELPINIAASEQNNNVVLRGFLDLVLFDEANDIYTIIDIKTSRQGWNDHQKRDKIKQAQLVLYKEYLAKQYGIPVDKIEIKFFVIKRQIQENVLYPTKRVQEIVPPSGKPTRNKLLREVDEFIRAAFTTEGEYNTAGQYPSIAGKGQKNCRYCPFKDRDDLCKKTERIKQ